MVNAEVVITPEMMEAGALRLSELRQADVGLSYAASEVFLAMWELRPRADQALRLVDNLLSERRSDHACQSTTKAES